MRTEVESLLQHDRLASEHFLQPAHERTHETALTQSCQAGAGKHAADASTPSEPKIPDYEIVAFIGKGGFGEVWLARQLLTDVFCAVKTIPHSSIGQLELEGVRQYKQRATSHPHLLSLEHVGQTGDGYYYVMELADDARGSGVREPCGYEAFTLTEHVRRNGALPVEQAVEIVAQLLDGLEHLHGAGLLHRDVKPANVFRKDGLWKLGDMGLITSHSQAEQKAGTPLYAPPEGVHDRSGDLFCTGRLLLELITGASPTANADPGEIPRPGDSVLVEQVLDTVKRACEPEPLRRFQSAAEMRAALVGEPRFIRGHAKWGYAAASVLLLMAAAVCWWLLNPRQVAPPPHTTEPTLEVIFKRSADDPGHYVLDEHAVPLHTGALIQIRGELPDSAYPYLFHIGGGQDVSLLFPEEPGGAKAVDTFAVPPTSADPDHQEWLPLQPPAGTEMLLLLVANRPLPDVHELTAALAPLRVPALDRASLLLGDPEAPHLRWDQTRGLGSERQVAPRGMLQSLGDDWRARFRYARVLAFPHVE